MSPGQRADGPLPPPRDVARTWRRWPALLLGSLLLHTGGLALVRGGPSAASGRAPSASAGGVAPIAFTVVDGGTRPPPRAGDRSVGRAIRDARAGAARPTRHSAPPSAKLARAGADAAHAPPPIANEKAAGDAPPAPQRQAAGDAPPAPQKQVAGDAPPAPQKQAADDPATSDNASADGADDDDDGPESATAVASTSAARPSVTPAVAALPDVSPRSTPTSLADKARAATGSGATAGVERAAVGLPVERLSRAPWLVPGSCTRLLAYPDSAMRLGKEGVVRLLVSLDEHGNVLQAKVIGRAGYGLDEAAVEAVRSRCQFAPARGADGQAVSALVEHVFAFRIADFTN